MPYENSTLENNDGHFAKKKYFYILSGILLGLCFLYITRSCTLGPFSETSYRIGQSGRWEQLNLMGNERNFGAFSNELLTAVGKNQKIRIKTVISSNLVQELKEGNLEGILTTETPNYLNENQLIFSDPYFLTGPVLIIPIHAPTDGWNEKRKQIVGIPSTSPHLLNLEEDPSIQVKVYQDILQALADLSERRIDGVIFPIIPAYTYTSTFYKHELKIATLPLTSEGVRLAALKNKTGESLIEAFNAGLTLLKQEGAYLQLLKRWNLINADVVSDSSNQEVKSLH